MPAGISLIRAHNNRLMYMDIAKCFAFHCFLCFCGSVAKVLPWCLYVKPQNHYTTLGIASTYHEIVMFEEGSPSGIEG